VKSLRFFVFVFVILSVVIGLSIQEFTELEPTLDGTSEYFEAGGKIIEVDISDGATGALGLGER